MARPDTSEVTAEEFEALFNEDGPLEEETEAVEEDSGEESEDTEENDPEEEAAASGEEDEEGDDAESEDESEEEEEPSVDWQEKAERLERDSRKLQSELTKRSNAYKEVERSLPQLRAKADALDRWNSLLGQYPQLQQIIEREVQALKNPMASIEVPKGMENDPAVQYAKRLMETQANYARGLEQKLAQYESRLGKVDQWENQAKEKAATQQLDGLLDQAKAEIKSMFGRDATEQELDQVLEYMTENDFYKSGKIAAFHVFHDQYRKLSTRAQTEKAREKANRFPARKKGINPSRVGRPKEASSPEEAIAMSLADQGFGI